MNTLDKWDLVKMIEAGDNTGLRLHWAGEDSEATTGTAPDILDEIQAVSSDRESGLTLDEAWGIAYVATEAEYTKELIGQLEDSLDHRDHESVQADIREEIRVLTSRLKALEGFRS